MTTGPKGTSSRKFTDEQCDLIARAYREGMTIAELAERHHASKTTIRNVLILRNVSRRVSNSGRTP